MNNKLPDVIYHYCSIESFYSILLSNYIYASLHTSLNDYSESAWFYQLLLSKANIKHTDSNKEKLNSFLNNVFINIKDYFISSFSKEDDVLSQWKAYADNGKGVAIGFYTNSFGIKEQVPSYSLSVHSDQLKGIFEINYDEQYHNSLAENIIDLVINDKDVFNINFENFTLSIKNPAFHEEKEIRIVEIMDTRINFNPDHLGLETKNIAKHLDYRLSPKGDIIPYRKFNLFLNNERKLHSLKLGPKCNIHPKHLNLFVMRNEIEIINGISISKSTYR